METTRRDFGDVFTGEELEQTFYVRNVGTKALELKEKSTLGSLNSKPTYSLTEAAWHPSAEYSPRTVAATRAAPS